MLFKQNQCSLASVCLWLAINFFAANGQLASAPSAPSPAPSSPQATRYLTVQLGGADAKAGPGLLNEAQVALVKVFPPIWDTCQVYDAWNISTCTNGAPAPAPYTLAADLGLLPFGVKVPAPAPAPGAALNSLTAWHTSSGEEAGEHGRRLRQVAGAQDAQDSVLPSPTRPCTAQMAVIFKLVSFDGLDPGDLSETAISLVSGAYLAELQDNGLQLEQAVLVNFTDHDPHQLDINPAPDSNLDQSDLYSFTPQPGYKNSSLTFVQFSFTLVGDDAQVADDAVLKALFDMVVDPAFNGGNGSWLTSPNTAIVDVRQGPPVPTRGRRLIEFPPMLDIQSWRRRRLAQDPGALSPGGGPIDPNATNPSIEVTIKARNVPYSAVSAVKDAANYLASGTRLVDGFQAKNFSINSVSLSSFNFQATNYPPEPPKGLPAPPPLAIAPRSSHRTVVILVLSIALPVCVVGAVFIGCAIVWWGRQSQRNKASFNLADSMESGMKDQGGSGLSAEQFGLLGMPSAASHMVREAHPKNLSQSRLIDMPWSDWKIEPSELTILTKPDGNKWLLGSGASGTVYKALRNGVQIVAVKLFKDEVTRGAINSLNSWRHAVQFRQEISILKSCHDRNIVQFVGACLAEGQTSLVTEFLENGDLYRAINSPQGSRYHWYKLQTPDNRAVPNSGMARRVALDVARGLHFLHTKKIVHFDLKSANILLARDFTAKIADVGLAKVLHDDMMSTRREVGTFAWAAPEILLGQKTTESADIYSFGVLLHELSAQESPRDRHLRRLSVPEEVPPEVNALISRCLDVRPEERPTARELVSALGSMTHLPCFPPVAGQNPGAHLVQINPMLQNAT